MGIVKPFDTDGALARMRERTQAARDHEAEEMFAAEKFHAAMSTAAAKGQTSVLIEPSIPMDVSSTDIAKTFVEMLLKAGFSAEWETRLRSDGDAWRCLKIGWAPK